MFNIGLPEFLVMALVAVVVIKPEQLPGLFRNLGKGLRQVARIRDEVMQGLREVKQDLGLDEAALKAADGRGADGRGADGRGADGRGVRPGVPTDPAAAPVKPSAAEPRPATESYDQGGGI